MKNDTKKEKQLELPGGEKLKVWYGEEGSNASHIVLTTRPEALVGFTFCKKPGRLTKQEAKNLAEEYRELGNLVKEKPTN